MESACASDCVLYIIAYCICMLPPRRWIVRLVVSNRCDYGECGFISEVNFIAKISGCHYI